MSADTRAVGARIMLAVDGLFLGALLFIDVGVKHQYLALLGKLGAAGPGWPDAGGAPGAALPWAAAAAVLLAAILLRTRMAPLPPFFLLLAAIACTATALRSMVSTGAAFGIGRYGTLTTVLAVVWTLHLLGAMLAIGWRRRPAAFVAVQAAFGIGLAAVVFPG